MRRADRRDSNHDNEVRQPYSRQSEPTSVHELSRLLKTVRSQKDEYQQKAREFEASFQEWKGHAETNLQLLVAEQERTQSYIVLYTEEQTRAAEFKMKYEQAEAQTQHYMTLYQQTKSELLFERRSKAGIKSWETRRKKENERLKREIAEMTAVLRESLAKKDEAITNLYDLAERMDRIQTLVDSVEDDSTSNPLGLVQKFKRIWQAVKEILAE